MDPQAQDFHGDLPDIAREVRRARRKAATLGWTLVMPALLYLTLAFAFPIASVLYAAVSNSTVPQQLPRTARALQEWSGDKIPNDEIADAMISDLRACEKAKVAEIARDLNNRIGGFRTLLIKTRSALDSNEGSGMAALVNVDPRWADATYWNAMRDATRVVTPFYILAALDLRQAPDGTIELAPEGRRIYLQYIGRTFWICTIVTLACALIGYPMAYFIANSTPRMEKLLLFALLIPFWTSVLVRTAAWVIVLQREGMVNDFLIGLRVIDEPLTLIYNRFAVYVAMTHVLLPFMVLPIYSVMKSIPPHLVRAALSLGARPWAAFREVYLPLSLPGLSSGVVMVFILGLGYYITPALVGGATDQMESGLIANFALGNANWSMASAISLVLLLMTGLIFLVLKRALHVSRLSLD